MASEDYRCPVCDSTIRATGGGSALYETGDDMNKVVPHDLGVFSEYGVEAKIGYLHYCPNQTCPIWRLFPLDWNGGSDE